MHNTYYYRRVKLTNVRITIKYASQLSGILNNKQYDISGAWILIYIEASFVNFFALSVNNNKNIYSHFVSIKPGFKLAKFNFNVNIRFS